MCDLGFLSTALTIEGAYAPCGGAIYRMELPAGSHGMLTSHAELILPRGLAWRVSGSFDHETTDRFGDPKPVRLITMIPEPLGQGPTNGTRPPRAHIVGPHARP